MKLTESSTLSEVALAVGAVLRRHGIRAVLTGGACVAVYTDGSYISKDVDFVVQNSIRQATLDSAMAELGFHLKGQEYVHATVPFFVEFPPGPLAVGGDYNVHPVELKGPEGTVLALSATDMCKDRLAAFYFWRDRQSRRLAIAIARHNELDFDNIRRWSVAEGHEADFKQFLREVQEVRQLSREPGR